MFTSRPARRALAGAGAVLLAAVMFTIAPVSGAPGRSAPGGKVSVLYAGSLVSYMENELSPAFQRATGYGYQGFGGGSIEVANEIKGGVRQGDVFISASAKADQSLEGAANGNWVSWYSTFAASPLVLAYNPKSRFATALRRGVPWYKVLTEKGILVGRTDPKLDPKGVLTVEAVVAGAKRLHDPALSNALGSFQVFPETALVGRLQAGQLDAGFFYAVEAASAHLQTVPLTPVYKYAEYTITVLNKASDAAGAAALTRYLLNRARTYTLKQNGLNPQRPKFSGSVEAVPVSLRHVVGAR